MRVLGICVLIGFMMIACLARGQSGTSPQGAFVSGAKIAAAPGSMTPAHMVPESDLQRDCPYPAEAQKRHEEGVTKVRIDTDATGLLTNASVLASSGSAQLDAAALECVKKARFAPAMRGGVPISSVSEIAWKWKYVPMPLQTCDQTPSTDDEPGLSGIIGTLTIKLEPEAARQAPGGGRAIVCACLDESGKLVGEPEISVSSNNAFLDSGALKMAKAIPYRAGSNGCLRTMLVFVTSQ